MEEVKFIFTLLSVLNAIMIALVLWFLYGRKMNKEKKNKEARK